MAARSANVNVRVEPGIKEQAEAILESLGVSASAFINMTYRQGILRKGIPFSVQIPSGIQTRDTITDEEFDKIMQTGLMQAKAGEAVSSETAFNQLMKGL